MAECGSSGPGCRFRSIRATLGLLPSFQTPEPLMQISLAGRTAVITGASKGLGLAMATRFAASGADVAMLARRPDVLAQAKAAVEKTAKGRVAVFACDVAKAADIARAHAEVMRTFGKV